MPRMTIEDLKRIRQEARGTLTARMGEARARIIVHMGTCGIAAGSRDVMAALLKEIEVQQIHDVNVTASSCAGLCSREPMATVQLAGEAPVKYADLTPEKMVEILNRHVMQGEVVKESALASGCETTA
jgi:NADP-reducing hydrogenase subunit HndB